MCRKTNFYSILLAVSLLFSATFLLEATAYSAPAKQLSEIKCTSDDFDYSIHFLYNKDTNLLERITYSNLPEWAGKSDYEFEYDENDRLIRIEKGNKEEDYYNYRYLELAYNSDGKLSMWKYFGLPSGDGLGAYFYDEQGNILRSFDFFGLSSEVHYTYNDQKQIESILNHHYGDYYFEYDNQGRFDLIAEMNDDAVDYDTANHFKYYPYLVFKGHGNSQSYQVIYIDLGLFSDFDPFTQYNMAQHIYFDIFATNFDKITSISYNRNGYITAIKGASDSECYEFFYSD